MAQHDLVRHPLVLRRVTVLRVDDVTPRMRRITVGGPQLGCFTTTDGLPMPAFTTASFDDHVKLVLATDGDVVAALPVQRARSIDWPPAANRAGRDYTPRRFDPVTGELDLDVVLHGSGPAQRWATAVAPGDPLWFAGPKSSLVLPTDVDWVLLAGDETALPAIGRYLDERPLDVPVHVVAEVGHPSARQDLPLREGDTLRWVLGPGRLVDAVQELDWPAGTPYVWAAGESRSLLPLRRWLREDRQVPRDHTDVTGYWHRDPAATDGTPLPDAEVLLSPVPWFLTRTALEAGLLAQLGSAPVPVADLAARTGLPADGLAVLLAPLAEAGVVALDGDAAVLGPVGEELLGEDHLREELFGTGLAARTLDALPHLDAGLRSGQAPWVLAHGRSLAGQLSSDPDLAADAVAAAGSFAFVAAGVPDLRAWVGAARIAVRGPGSAVLLHAAAGRGPLPAVTVVGSPVQLHALAADLAPLPVDVSGPSGPVDLVVSTLETSSHTDAELRELLDALAGVAERLLVVDVLSLTGPGSPAAAGEHALHTLLRTGRPPRTADDLRATAGAAGWRATGHTSLGWDHEVFEFVR